MKKLILLTLLAFIFFSVSFKFALTIKTQHHMYLNIKLNQNQHHTTTTTKTSKTTKAKAKGVAGAYAKCLNLEMKNLTKEMQSRKKTALAEYKNALKNATSTEAKREARKAYNTALRDINKWFNQATKEAKEKCISTATSTPTQLLLLQQHQLNNIVVIKFTYNSPATRFVAGLFIFPTFQKSII
jgi:hypothetical protein